jgi:hypothetical protein
MNYSNMSLGKPVARALFSFNLNTLILHARSGERQARDRFRQHLTATSTILRGEGGEKAGKQRVVDVPYVAEADYLASRSENLRFLPGAAIGAGNSPAAPMNVGAATRISTKAATELGAVMLHLQVIDDRP